MSYDSNFYRVDKRVSRTVPVQTLIRLTNLEEMDTPAGQLTLLEAECQELIDEITKTAKEVEGDPEMSERYRTAKAIQQYIADLRRVLKGLCVETPAKAYPTKDILDQ